MKKFSTPLEAFLYWESKIPNEAFLRQHHKGQIDVLSFKEVGDQARRVARFLQDQDLPAKSKIALLSKNSDAWILSDLAIMMSGHISVPIYPTLQASSIAPIVEHSETAIAFVGKLDDYKGQEGAFDGVHTIGFKKYDENCAFYWEDLCETHEPLDKIGPESPDDLVTIIYTSGTTGMPKGVMHSHRNFANAVYNIHKSVDMVENPKFFSYLPLSHIAERIGLENGAILLGGSLTFPESLDTFATNLEQTQPDMFFAVPRIYAKFQEKIREGLPQKKLNVLLKIPLLSTLLKKKIKAKLGLSRACAIASGAAPISVDMLNWYKKLDVNILQAYGMTEDCIISHCNVHGANRIGTVGRTTYGAKAKLTAEGQICVKNDSLMLGYYKLPEETAKVFDSDGYLLTGDVGEYDHDGYLTITGRAKDQFKTDKGKYISPAPIELSVSKNEDIEQVCVVGMGIPQPILLVVPSETGLAKDRQSLVDSLCKSIDEINPSLEKHEVLEKAVVMKEQWSIENGLLTPTLKIKRSQVEKIHRPMYRSWFDQQERVIFE